MYCNKCGKEIPNDALFCNHCGSKVVTVQSQAKPQSAYQAAPKPSAQAYQQPSSNPSANASANASGQSAQKKNGGCGTRILGLIVCVVVYLIVRYGAENVFSGNFKLGGISAKQLVSSAQKGALYENDYLTYGLARIHAPMYTHVDVSGSDGDHLLSLDGSKIITVYLNDESNVSYSKTSKESMKNSFLFNSYVNNVIIEEFSKYEVNGVKVAECIISCSTTNGAKQYIGELIIFPKEKPDQTLRISMGSDARNGITSISSVFDTLRISEDFKYSIETSGLVLYPDKQITSR